MKLSSAIRIMQYRLKLINIRLKGIENGTIKVQNENQAIISICKESRAIELLINTAEEYKRLYDRVKSLDEQSQVPNPGSPNPGGATSSVSGSLVHGQPSSHGMGHGKRSQTIEGDSKND